MIYLPPHIRARLVVLGLIMAMAVLPSVRTARADYTPPAAPYVSRVGTAGTLVQNQGTPLDANDAESRWNAWTARSYLSMGTGGCGFLNSCIIYAPAGAIIYYALRLVPGQRRTSLLEHPRTTWGARGLAALNILYLSSRMSVRHLVGTFMSNATRWLMRSR